ncbi:uncharacterized protein KZ484_013447 [Pholidichthys leucotaenia]
MSNRDSLGFGDLLPQDVVDIFSQEKHGKKGQKKRSRSLGRAFGWLKGKKRKELSAKGQNLTLGPALDLALEGHPAGNQGGQRGGQKSGKLGHHQGNNHAGLKRDDDDDKTPAPPLLQENVFIESTRPKYLEDLHTEALEGLKMLQEEETNHGVEYRDNESTISTSMSVQTDGESTGFATDSTIADTASVVSVQSSVSSRSSRSGLTRQGSTFRPLNSGKKSEKKRRRHRKTVAGIPHHVQRELGLDRVSWMQTQKGEQLYNGDSDLSPTTDEPRQADNLEKSTDISAPNVRLIQPLNKENIKQLDDTHEGHRDNLALLPNLGPVTEDGSRLHSLAVPWVTADSSHQQGPPSPVMTMSPQAAYMSKIIPNAVLPPSVDVVEISRGRSRNSVRTVSKSSLVLSSPTSSRASSRASSSRTTSSRGSNLTSASRHNLPRLSDTSCWSVSDSSETLVSDSSTISRSSTPKQKVSQNGNAPIEDNKIGLHSSVSKTSKDIFNRKVDINRDESKTKEQFVRSLSVMKSKKAPPPPSRSYSLHNKMKRRSRDLPEVRIILGETSHHSTSSPGDEGDHDKPVSTSPVPVGMVDSPGYHGDTSSLDESMSSASFSPFKSQLQVLTTDDFTKDREPLSQEVLKDHKLSKVISPSSGYSSQEATFPQLHKQSANSSPKPKKGLLAKLQKLFPGPSTAGSAPSPSTQQEESPKSISEPKPDSVDAVSVRPTVWTLRDLFNIPPPPKVRAPPPPPPECWAHNPRTCELLLGYPVSCPIVKKNPKDRRQYRSPPSVATESSVKNLVVERKHRNPCVTLESNVPEAKKVQEGVILNAEIHKENDERLTQNVSLNGHSKEEKVRVSDILNGMLVKAVEKREERLAAIREEETKKPSTQATEMELNTETLPNISFVCIPPAASPPQMQNLPQPLSRQTVDVAHVTTVQTVSSESSWPPPPPPMTQGRLGSPEELYFPLPPPPLFGDDAPSLPAQEPPKNFILGGDQTCTIISVTSVMKMESDAKKSSSMSQEMAPSSLNIPPPPSYTAPPPPTMLVSHATTYNVTLPPVKVSPPPPPVVVIPIKPKDSHAPVAQNMLSIIKEVSPTSVTVVAPPSGVQVFPQPPKEVFAVSTERVVPPPPQDVSKSFEEETPVCKLTLPISIPPPLPVQSQLQSSELEFALPQEVICIEPETITVSTSSILTPPQSIPPPPPIEPLILKMNNPASQEAPKIDRPTIQEASKTVDPTIQEDPKPNGPTAPEEVPKTSVITIEEVPENGGEPEQKDAKIDAQTIQETPKSGSPVILESPKSDDQTNLEAPPSPPPEVSMSPPPETSSSQEKVHESTPSPPIPPPLPVAGFANIRPQPSPQSTEDKSQYQLSALDTQGEPTPFITPSLLQMVKLRSVNSSPEPPSPEEQKQTTEVTVRKQELSIKVPTSSASGEAPQKPIRKSLIITSPTSGSPPPLITTPLPKSQSVVVPPAPTVVSPMKKSPPATTTSRSMNLQEAIRLRTAARSKENQTSRLSLHPPASPIDPHRSPTSTASFIFSKSNRKLVIETKPMLEAKDNSQKNLDISSVTTVNSEAEPLKKGIKVPPPVAKKPKTRGQEMEANEGSGHTAGEELQETISDAAEKAT